MRAVRVKFTAVTGSERWQGAEQTGILTSENEV